MSNIIRPPTELLEGVKNFLSTNRNSLSIEEISLLNDVSKYLELLVNQKDKIKLSEYSEIFVKIVLKLLEFFSNSSILAQLMDFK